MEANQGYATGHQAWARARLQRGRSSGEVWEISAAYPEARLTLGTDRGAGWQIEANGVKPLHCELFWDGASLWLADTHQAGGVFLDGQRISDWTQVLGPAEIRFGQAALDIETSAPPSQQMQSKPELARPVTVIDTGGVLLPPELARAGAASKGPSAGPPSGMVFGGAAGDQSVPELDVQSTSIARSPLHSDTSQVASPPDAMEGAKTQMVKTPEARGLDLRPRLGVSTAPVTGHAPETTRMVSMPVAAPMKAAPPPSLGRPVGAPTVPPTRKSPAAPPPPPPAASAPPPPPPSRPAPPSPPGPPQPAPTPAGPTPGAPVVGGFAAPPEPTEPEDKPDNWVVRTLKHEKSADMVDGKQSLPPRTWALLIVTLLVTVGWLLWDDTPEVEATPQPPAGAVVVLPGGSEPEPTPVEGTPTEGTPAEATAVDAGAQAVPDPLVVAEPTPDPSDPPDGESEDGPTLQRRAADAYMAGRLDDALGHYRQLAEQDPESDVWPAMVQILERRTSE
ncbi:MAG: FHA domain-containing protein [Sandaracinaceae bacterium]